MLHVGDFYITDGAAWRELLEICLKFQLGKSIDFLCHMDMVAVGNVIFVRYVRNNAKTLLETFGEAICGGLHGSAVYRVADIFSSLPLSAFVIQTLHNL